MKQSIVGLLFALTLLLLPNRAEAKGIPVIYNTGEEAFEAGPVPAPFDQEPGLAGYQAGYLCSVKGIVWSYFSVSNCKPVAFKGDSYTDEPELVKAITAKYKESDMKLGFWGKFGWMLLALGVVLGGLIYLKELVSGKKETDTDKEESA